MLSLRYISNPCKHYSEIHDLEKKLPAKNTYLETTINIKDSRQTKVKAGRSILNKENEAYVAGKHPKSGKELPEFNQMEGRLVE